MATKPTLVPPPATLSVSEARARLHGGAATPPPAQPAPPGLLPTHAIKPAQVTRDDEYDRVPMVLSPSQIKPFDRNPRTTRNPAYDELYSSIEADGLHSQVSVTRRPGSQEFMIYGGGNTRLEIMQALAAKFPGDPKFAKMNVVFRTWRGESWPLIAHHVENETRGDTSFWDRATGIARVRLELQKEARAEHELPLNEVRTQCEARGLSISRDTLQLYQFATETLAPIGQWLTFSNVKALRSRIKSIADVLVKLDPTGLLSARFANELHTVLELAATSMRGSEEATKGIGSPVELDVATLCGAMEDAAGAIGEVSVQEMRQMFALVSNSPSISASHLRAEARKGLQPKREAPPQAISPPTPTQAVLPTAMLAGVPPASPTAVDGGVSATAPELPSGDDELATVAAAQPGAVPRERAADKQPRAPGLPDEAMRFAQRFLLSDLFMAASAMPAGYYVDLPDGRAFVEGDAKRDLVARAGWSLLALLSGQLDKRIASMVPDSSRWSAALRDGLLSDRLADAGVVLGPDGEIGVDACALYVCFAEDQFLGPALIELLRAGHAAFKASPTFLPKLLAPVTTGGAAA
jgi:ParB family protein of integrating conjugative element (PFGI_1 class)